MPDSIYSGEEFISQYVDQIYIQCRLFLRVEIKACTAHNLYGPLFLSKERSKIVTMIGPSTVLVRKRLKENFSSYKIPWNPWLKWRIVRFPEQDYDRLSQLKQNW